jgi:hypothetical protein
MRCFPEASKDPARYYEVIVRVSDAARFRL